MRQRDFIESRRGDGEITLQVPIHGEKPEQLFYHKAGSDERKPLAEGYGRVLVRLLNFPADHADRNPPVAECRVF